MNSSDLLTELNQAQLNKMVVQIVRPTGACDVVPFAVRDTDRQTCGNACTDQHSP